MIELELTAGARAFVARGARQLRGGRGDAVLTLGSQAVVTTLRLVTLRLAAMLWSHETFGAFVTARRSVNYVYLPVLCGMGLALTHAIASTIGRRDEHFGRFAVGAFVIVLSSLTIGWSIGALFARPLSALLFGSADETTLLWSVGLAASGLALHGLAYGFLQGQMRMVGANVLQFVMIGLCPCLLLLLPGSSPQSVLSLSGVAEGVAAILVLAIGVRASDVEGMRRMMPSWADVRQLLRYGLPRIPGEFALGALLAVPVTIVARNAGMSAAGIMGVCMSLMALIGGMFAPIGQVLLPRIANYTARGDMTRFQSDRRKLTVISLIAGTVVGLIAIPLAPFAVSILAPWARLSGARVARIVAVGAFPYVVHILLRGMLDGVSPRAINAKNLILSVLLLLLVCAINSSPEGVAFGLVLSMWLLGSTTLYECWAIPTKTVSALRD